MAAVGLVEAGWATAAGVKAEVGQGMAAVGWGKAVVAKAEVGTGAAAKEAVGTGVAAREEVVYPEAASCTWNGGQALAMHKQRLTERSRGQAVAGQACKRKR
jgi:hypothetical protein